MTVTVSDTDVARVLKIQGAEFQTTSYDGSTFERQNKGKGVIIYVDADDIKKIESFGLKVYDNSKTAKDGEPIVHFIMTTFSANLAVYDTNSMTVKRGPVDDRLPNFRGKDYEFAIMEIENSKQPGKFFYRVVAMKGNSLNITNNAIDFFGDDADFTDERIAGEVTGKAVPKIEDTEMGQTPYQQ